MVDREAILVGDLDLDLERRGDFERDLELALELVLKLVAAGDVDDVDVAVVAEGVVVDIGAMLLDNVVFFVT